MKNKKLLVLALGLILFPKTSYAKEDIKIYIDDIEIKSDVSAVIEDGRTLVPLRTISEGLGAEIDWQEDTRGVGLSKDNSEVLWIYCDKNIAEINNTKISFLEKEPKIINNRTFVPIRFIAENFDLIDKENYNTGVFWDEESKSVKIYSDINDSKKSEEEIFISQIEKIQNIILNISKEINNLKEPEKKDILNINKIRIENINKNLRIPTKYNIKYEEYIVKVNNILNNNFTEDNLRDLNNNYEILSGKKIKKFEEKKLDNTRDIDVNTVKFILDGKELKTSNRVINNNGSIMISGDLLAEIWDAKYVYRGDSIALQEGVYGSMHGIHYTDKESMYEIVEFFRTMKTPGKMINNVMYIPIEAITHHDQYGYTLKNNVVNIYNRDKINGKLSELLKLQYILHASFPNNDSIKKLYNGQISLIPLGNRAWDDEEALTLQLELKENKEINEKMQEFLSIRKDMARKYVTEKANSFDKMKDDKDYVNFNKGFDNLKELPMQYNQLEEIYYEICQMYVQNGYY